MIIFGSRYQNYRAQRPLRYIPDRRRFPVLPLVEEPLLGRHGTLLIVFRIPILLMTLPILQKDTFDKVLRFYQSEEYLDAPPLQEAYRTCKRLKTLGYRLVVVTARSEEHRQITEDAITRYFPGESGFSRAFRSEAHCGPCPRDLR